MAHENPHLAQSPGPAEEPTPAAHVRIRLVPENAEDTFLTSDAQLAAEPGRGRKGQPAAMNPGHSEQPTSAADLKIRLIPAQWRK